MNKDAQGRRKVERFESNWKCGMKTPPRPPVRPEKPEKPQILGFEGMMGSLGSVEHWIGNAADMSFLAEMLPHGTDVWGPEVYGQTVRYGLTRLKHHRGYVGWDPLVLQVARCGCDYSLKIVVLANNVPEPFETVLKLAVEETVKHDQAFSAHFDSLIGSEDEKD